jgi:hypothetical protein
MVLGGPQYSLWLGEEEESVAAMIGGEVEFEIDHPELTLHQPVGGVCQLCWIAISSTAAWQCSPRSAAPHLWCKRLARLLNKKQAY